MSLAPSPGSSIVALLGPTNTGKTHRAIERMLEHESGMIGLPLRLLAREVYDKLTTRAGESQVALVTGEEKRIPRRPRYWVCTVEAMPVAFRSQGEGPLEVDFLAVDEIQLAAHPERGHVFTERLLHARGRLETMFLGADTMRGALEALVPTARTTSSPRLSRLTSAGASSLGQLKKRTAIVAFSIQRVYEIAERVRARRGGAAIVLGALSPRARNAQVALYQSGEVDYLVATDAIGMGLNLDIDHVAFADLRKFDGREGRELEPAEIAQIAGRAGRHTRDGTFGTLAPLAPLPDRVARDLEEHRFDRIRHLVWRNPHLDFSSLDSLSSSLEEPPPSRMLRRIDRTDDHAALNALRNDDDYRRLRGEEAVTIAWEVCRIPDYRQILFEDHLATLKSVLDQLVGPRAKVSPDFLSTKLEGLSNPAGDLESLMGQIAAIRTWNYVANQSGWVDDAGIFQARATEIENRLGDALHEALVARFVDRSRTARPSSPGKTAAKSSPGERREPAGPFAALAKLTVAGAAREPERSLVEELVAADHDEIALDSSAVIRFLNQSVAKMIPGRDLLTPDVLVTADLSPSERLRAHRRLVAFTRDVVHGLFAELDDATTKLSPMGRGLVYLLKQRLGTLLAADARNEIAGLTESDREALAKAGIVVGSFAVYVPRLLKQTALNERQALVTALLGPRERVRFPEGSAVSLWPIRGLERILHSAIGFPWVGPRAVRADVLERVAGRLDAATDDERPTLPLAGWLGSKGSDVEAIIAAANAGR